jgi:(p)ppGpp synthase/HD superfamily hydrolase
MNHETSRYERLSIALKYYLIGKGYNLALAALQFAKQKHDGLRKDGVTPEVQHQIEIALYLTTLKGIREEENTIVVALLHDIIEDCDVNRETIEIRFGESIADSVWAISKKINGKPKYTHINADLAYYDDCARDLRASIVKAADRIHNNNSMAGVFSTEKQSAYVSEVEKHFLPMLKTAEGLFPDQFMAYMNAKHMLKSQAALVRNALSGDLVKVHHPDKIA